MPISKFDMTLDKGIEFLKEDEAIPVVSALLILLLFFVADFGYRLIETGTMLLFYAVLVRMWTAMTPSDSELLRGSFSHPVFLLMSAGAVAMGIMIEQWVASLTGYVLPAQFLALAVLISGLYLNFRSGESMLEALLWEKSHHRYVVLIPCLVVTLLPIVIHQFEISSLIIVDARFFVSRTTESFIWLSALGISCGALAYLRFEEEVGVN